MSHRIRILPDNLTNKIAAGEVVERPASVVKELVENALDAGCREVVVEIEQGGKRLIRVTDDGSGMGKDDALLAMERHATSKIASDDDLFALATLGFRGEALPSIASVSRFTLASREEGELEGAEIYAEGGRIREVKACGMATGTVVTVRNLFFNTPARLKFLKSADTEGGHVADLLTRLALSRPAQRFTYLCDGRTVFLLLSGDLKARAAALLGTGIGQSLHPVDWRDGDLEVTGLVAAPSCCRSSAGHLYTYINGRFIRDRVVQHAVLQAYRNFLEKGRYPVVVLFITLPPGEVDVNVHPTKHEVRFREQGRVHDGILHAVESVLRGTPWLARGEERGRGDVSPQAEERLSGVREALARYRAEAPRQYSFPAVPPPSGPDREPVPPLPVTPAPSPAAPSPAAPEEPCAGGYFSSLTLIGQLAGAYLLCQDGVDLVIIDQHAAHERVAFERLKRECAAGGVESQGLLFPEPVEFTHAEGATVAENREHLSRLGFELESFGGTTWLLKGVPRLVAAGDYLPTLRDTVADLSSIGRSSRFDDHLEELLARIACHSVVRGSRHLGRDEVVSLFAQMDATDFASNCPHGRPVSRTISRSELERMFKRS